ncbi:MAG: iron-containing alcohol dehydrogenase [Sideroxydans sp.]|nr:iron-containing alcohol dehydrogenase [Sideroxydans sp.]
MDNALELRKFVVPEFVFGAGALNLVGRYAKNFGAKKALVVTDPGVARTAWLGHVLDALKAEQIPWVVFQDVTPNPKNLEVSAGVEFYRDNGCDIIIAVGGGSPMDCAKGIGIAFENGKDVLAFEGVDEVQRPGPPLICIPTTAGSSADISQFAIINDTTRKVKIAIISKTVVPDVSLIDPETTTTMPTELTAATGLDALVHAMEAYVSNASSPITDMNALAAIPLLVQNLVPSIEDPLNITHRNNMMMGSLLAGMAFSNASLGLVHAMAHSLGGLSGLPHGMCNAMLVDHVVDFNYMATPERYDRISIAMGLELEGLSAEKRKAVLLQGLIGLRTAAGIETTLGALGIKRADIKQLALNAFNDPCLATNPRRASVQEIEGLYEKAL